MSKEKGLPISISAEEYRNFKEKVKNGKASPKLKDEKKLKSDKSESEQIFNEIVAGGIKEYGSEKTYAMLLFILITEKEIIEYVGKTTKDFFLYIASKKEWVVNSVDGEKGSSPLEAAILCENYEMMDLLSVFGGDPIQRDKLGNTPFHILCDAKEDRNYARTVSSFLAAGVDLFSKNKEGHTPFNKYMAKIFSKKASLKSDSEKKSEKELQLLDYNKFYSRFHEVISLEPKDKESKDELAKRRLEVFNSAVNYVEQEMSREQEIGNKKAQIMISCFCNSEFLNDNEKYPGLAYFASFKKDLNLLKAVVQRGGRFDIRGNQDKEGNFKPTAHEQSIQKNSKNSLHFPTEGVTKRKNVTDFLNSQEKSDRKEIQKVLNKALDSAGKKMFPGAIFPKDGIPRAALGYNKQRMVKRSLKSPSLNLDISPDQDITDKRHEQDNEISWLSDIHFSAQRYATMLLPGKVVTTLPQDKEVVSPKRERPNNSPMVAKKRKFTDSELDESQTR